MAVSADSPSLQDDCSAWSANVTAANTARDGTGTLNEIIESPADGMFLYGIRFSASGAQVASLANIFRYDGASYFLERQVPLPAITSSTTVPDEEVFVQFGKKIRAGDTYYFTICQAVASGWKAMALADGYTSVL